MSPEICLFFPDSIFEKCLTVAYDLWLSPSYKNNISKILNHIKPFDWFSNNIVQFGLFWLGQQQNCTVWPGQAILLMIISFSLLKKYSKSFEIS